MSLPTISVIIPAFNAEGTIRSTVESVLSQSFSDLELIVINDDSTDGTVSVLSDIEDTRLRIISFANSGVAVSRNRGIQEANGHYISFLDADDLWAKDKLKEQYEALKVNPDAAVAYSWTDYIDMDDKFVHTGWHPHSHGDVYEAIFCKNFIENGSNILAKREAIETVGCFDVDAGLSEDWDLYLRLAEKFRFVCVPQAHILYRIRPNSQSNNIKRMEMGFLSALSKAVHKSPDRLSPLKHQALSNFYSYLFYKSYKDASNPQQYRASLGIFLRGIFHSPQVWKLVAKRQLLQAFRGAL